MAYFLREGLGALAVRQSRQTVYYLKDLGSTQTSGRPAQRQEIRTPSIFPRDQLTMGRPLKHLARKTGACEV